VDELIELSERLLEPFYAREQTSTKNSIDQKYVGRVQLVVGNMPDPLSKELPIPDDSRIIGTLLLEHGFVALLDVYMPTGRVLRFYEERLTASGWMPYGWESANGKGRRSTLNMLVPARVILSFYRDEAGPVLFVSVDEQLSGVTHVRLTVDNKPEPTVDLRSVKVAKLLTQKGIVPHVPAPIGGNFYKIDIDMSSKYESTRGTLLCQDSIDEIHAYYVGQLVERDWTLVSSNSGNRSRWSSWIIRISDEVFWVGLLNILQRPWSKYKYEIHLMGEPPSGASNDVHASDGPRQFRTSHEAYFPRQAE
jgi:hypothetical protein